MYYYFYYVTYFLVHLIRSFNSSCTSSNAWTRNSLERTWKLVTLPASACMKWGKSREISVSYPRLELLTSRHLTATFACDQVSFLSLMTKWQKQTINGLFAALLAYPMLCMSSQPDSALLFNRAVINPESFLPKMHGNVGLCSPFMASNRFECTPKTSAINLALGVLKSNQSLAGCCFPVHKYQSVAILCQMRQTINWKKTFTYVQNSRNGKCRKISNDTPNNRL